MSIEVGVSSQKKGLDIYDSIEQRRIYIETAQQVSLEEASPDDFHFPVDTACTFETDELRFDQVYSVTIHDSSGRSEGKLDVGETVQLEDRTQFIGFSGPMKLYFQIESAGTVTIGLTSIQLSFDQETRVRLGIRSLHDRPANTITTPPDLESMTEAVSVFPSALKTLSPERTWPTLRGHPPLVKLGDSLEIPDTIDRLENDITITIPETYQALFQAAPLAFYLGATIQIGTEPSIKAGQFEYPLGTGGKKFEDDVATVLKHVFFLDCITRGEGIFQYDLYERTMLADQLPFELKEMYTASLPERLERYLELSFDEVEQYMPRWPLTAHLPSNPETVELLPFIVNELGIIREVRGTTTKTIPSPDTTATQVVRSASRSETTRTFSPDTDRALVQPNVTDESIEHAWFGDGIPKNASKATIDAYRNQLSFTSRSESIEILLVCNDARMLDEHDLLDNVYGNRESLPFEIHSEFGVDSSRLASLLADGGYDFFHYIGHATEDGIRCPDTDLDVRSLDSVDVSVFFLNACRSYEQGLALTKRGAFGGVTTYSDVINEHAVEIGGTMARLLNRGFPLRAALEVARKNSVLGDEYLIVGDGSTDIAQSDGGAPAIIKLEESEESEYKFAIQSYSTKEYKLGTATASNLPEVDDRHLSPGYTPFSRVEDRPVDEYLMWNELPVLANGVLHWNDGISPFHMD